VVCAVSIFGVQCLTILDGNLCDYMGHGNVAYASLNVYVTCRIKIRGHYEPYLSRIGRKLALGWKEIVLKKMF